MQIWVSRWATAGNLYGTRTDGAVNDGVKLGETERGIWRAVKAPDGAGLTTLDTPDQEHE